MTVPMHLTRYGCWLSRLAICLVVSLPSGVSLSGGEPEKEGDWWVERDSQSGEAIHSMQLILHPAAEARPALAYQLIANDFDRIDGNAALYYLKALGFLEQRNAHKALMDYESEAVAKANAAGKEIGDVPPFSWLNTAPSEYPQEEVREYLGWVAFQQPLIAEAARRRNFDLDRNIREVENPIGYLLPEIQVLRDLARKQSVRCRLAIAENRIHDAIEILGQQYALAAHLGDDDFLVSNLVGVAISGIAFPDALYLVQQPEAPNLYWAYAALPDPLVSMQRAFAYEREFLFEQLKVLREVDEEPRPASYWQDFVDRLMPQLKMLVNMESQEFRLDGSPESNRAKVMDAIDAAYPGAKQFLIAEGKIDREAIEKYPTAQVVFLAMVRFHRQAADEIMKWNNIPYPQTNQLQGWERAYQYLEQQGRELGWAGSLTTLFLPALKASARAQQTAEQRVAMLQTVEAIRAYGAKHDGQLPNSLAALELPAPRDPLTGEDFTYSHHGEEATLSAANRPGITYQLKLRFAPAE